MEGLGLLVLLVGVLLMLVLVLTVGGRRVRGRLVVVR